LITLGSFLKITEVSQIFWLLLGDWAILFGDTFGLLLGDCLLWAA
jgi:hypothetical protein